MKRKSLVILIIIGVILLNAVAYYLSFTIYDNLKKNFLESNIEKIKAELNKVQRGINSLYENSAYDIRWLTELPHFAGYQGENASSAKVKKVTEWYERFIATHPQYLKIQFLDVKGFELIRINNASGKISIGEANDFVDNSHRPCYLNCRELHSGEIFSTPLELNVFHQGDEIQYLPTIRFASPIRSGKGELLGVVTLNLNPDTYFNEIYSSGMFILDSEGTYIIAEDPSRLYSPSGIDLSHSDGICPICMGNIYFQQAGPPDKPLYVGVHSYQAKISKIVKSASKKQFALTGLILVLSLGSIFALFFFFLQQDSKRLLEQTERLSAIGKISNIIVHDLKGPLTVIKAICDLKIMKLQKARECEDLISDFSDIRTAGDEQLSMLQEILDFSRGENIKLQLSQVQLANYLTERLKINSKFLRYVNIESDFGYDGSALIDKNRFNRVVDNLLKNAGEALSGREDAKLNILTRKSNGNVEITITDNGPGIPDDIKENIFKIGATSGKIKGTGIGLYSAKMIVELHGGKIDYSSEHDKGTSFFIRFPIERKQD